ncbi:hemerythrin domain-containing protein [Noviherbaspirillum sp.]|uniref:bacteriohemerythrin n=1 Tax=Noviherbaspirillum sp. TaxID=1926288 RepID=UPI002D3F53CE|nr:hemerythrin domain-containing protein [Noviherbaspirillum sp.]HZW20016.1 hemerythrin domain-containing protein [Noviherbaspirillum sp.]
MQAIKWTQDMSLGVTGMDAAHEEFLEDLSELLTTPDSRFAQGFMRLIEKVEKDFREEEELMEEIDYPGLHGHREQHARVLAALHHVAPHVMSGDVALGREAAELLPQWFLYHLSTMDTALAFALDAEKGDINPSAIRRAAERIRQGSGR